MINEPTIMAKTLTIELPDSTYRALEQAAASRGASPEAEAAGRLIQDLAVPSGEKAVGEELQRRGLVLRVPSRKPEQGPRFFLNRKLEKPLSESIIEERR